MNSAPSKPRGLSLRELSALRNLQPAAEIARRALAQSRMAQLSRFDWKAQARPEQLPPAGDWTIWLYLAGRGAGKTRSGAEFVRDEVNHGRATRIALVGATDDEVEKVMIFGQSGLLNIFPDWDRPRYYKGEIHFPNGAIATPYSAKAYERLRGPEHDLFWADELLKWTNMRATWDNLMFSLRLGARPRGFISSTPRPLGLLKEIMERPDAVVSRGTTYDNRSNLAKAFYDEIISKYEGTRFGRQEIMGEILDDVPNALWTRAMLDIVGQGGCVLSESPPLSFFVRVVVGVDPSGTTGEDDRDAVGIVVVGLGMDGIAYVLADWTCAMSPMGWAGKVKDAFHTFKADRIVAEVNFGGAMVEAVIHAADSGLPVRMVNASRGKVQRAEPVAAKYEKNKVRHVKPFSDLDDELIQFTSDGYQGERSPNRADALVWALTDLILDHGGGQAWVEHYADMAKAAQVVPVPGHLQQFVDYIVATGQAALPIKSFDEDWHPVGRRARAELVELGLIVEKDGRLALTGGAIGREPSSPTNRPAPAPEGNELTALYLQTLNQQLGISEQVCKNCGKPVVGARSTDGVSVWHPGNRCP